MLGCGVSIVLPCNVVHPLSSRTETRPYLRPLSSAPIVPQNALTRDVFSQLHTISSQQSKIREMKNKLALFRSVC